MFAPAGTPDADHPARGARHARRSGRTRDLEKLRGVGFDVRARGPEGLAERVAREVPMWRDVIVQSRIELQ